MTISEHIKSQYFVNEEQLIRLAPSQPPPLKPTKRKGTPWTDEEHNRFLEALEQYPAGPWKLIAEHVRTRTTRQTMTHAQRYREKIARRRRTLAEAGLPELSIKDEPSSSAAGATTAATCTTGPTPMIAASIASSSAFMMSHYDFDLDSIDFEDIQDEVLLLSLVESCDLLPFSEEDAHWLTEHYGTIAL
ncbi:Myb-like dna-binding protein [Globisporangium polare]